MASKFFMPRHFYYMKYYRTIVNSGLVFLSLFLVQCSDPTFSTDTVGKEQTKASDEQGNSGSQQSERPIKKSVEGTLNASWEDGINNGSSAIEIAGEPLSIKSKTQITFNKFPEAIDLKFEYRKDGDDLVDGTSCRSYIKRDDKPKLEIPCELLGSGSSELRLKSISNMGVGETAFVFIIEILKDQIPNGSIQVGARITPHIVSIKEYPIWSRSLHARNVDVAYRKIVLDNEKDSPYELIRVLELSNKSDEEMDLSIPSSTEYKIWRNGKANIQTYIGCNPFQSSVELIQEVVEPNDVIVFLPLTSDFSTRWSDGNLLKRQIFKLLPGKTVEVGVYSMSKLVRKSIDNQLAGDFGPNGNFHKESKFKCAEFAPNTKIRSIVSVKENAPVFYFDLYDFLISYSSEAKNEHRLWQKVVFHYEKKPTKFVQNDLRISFPVPEM